MTKAQVRIGDRVTLHEKKGDSPATGTVTDRFVRHDGEIMAIMQLDLHYQGYLLDRDGNKQQIFITSIVACADNLRLLTEDCPFPAGKCICTNGIGCANVPYERW